MKTDYEKASHRKTPRLQNDDYLQGKSQILSDDKEPRDVYEVLIERGNRKWKFEFGNSLADSKFVAVYGVREYQIPQTKCAEKAIKKSRYTSSGILIPVLGR